MAGELTVRKNPYASGQPWWLYMLECKGGGIYTGIALDVDARFEQHVAGKGAKYTRMNRPIRVVARIRYDTHREAAQDEVALKRLKPLEKLRWAYALAGLVGMDKSA